MFKDKVILASRSPRRQELLKLLGIDFKLIVKDTPETYPSTLKPCEIACFIAEKKAHAFYGEYPDSLVITADTIVELDGMILGKPVDEQDAINMLRSLSGKKHTVITGVTLLKDQHFHTFYEESAVYFGKITPEQIDFYVKKYKPLDKAGAYGIQEWIGLIGITKIDGSYTNVVGLPTERLYRELVNL